ncbi:hypothetical protein B0T14DRAFT_5547 [Immersiella caudata]|uniref:Uncharacterized protein n=1 Tax=Immersiella caudata TaxID=314043 RepID=A0AA39XDW8_9PEZI|nr:hypothetical protein B0T14DRAFT_5547 [Immersiella caudata]
MVPDENDRRAARSCRDRTKGLASKAYALGKIPGCRVAIYVERGSRVVCFRSHDDFVPQWRFPILNPDSADTHSVNFSPHSPTFPTHWPPAQDFTFATPADFRTPKSPQKRRLERFFEELEDVSAYSKPAKTTILSPETLPTTYAYHVAPQTPPTASSQPAETVIPSPETLPTTYAYPQQEEVIVVTPQTPPTASSHPAKTTVHPQQEEAIFTTPQAPPTAYSQPAKMTVLPPKTPPTTSPPRGKRMVVPPQTPPTTYPRQEKTIVVEIQTPPPTRSSKKRSHSEAQVPPPSQGPMRKKPRVPLAGSGRKVSHRTSWFE